VKRQPNPAAKAARPAPKRPCPTCGKDVDWSKQPDYRPFCSKRCRLIDLGEWASDRYSIPSDEAAGDPEAGLSPGDYQ
jgi:endogenous inhibitor of DNA gyrase (YacG/DUF329 family)